MLKILHVDNSTFFKKLLDEVARDHDFNCSSVGTPEEAFLLLENQKFDVIITAMEFKKISGIDFIEKLNKSNHRSIPKVILTSRDTFELRRMADQIGVEDCIPKDISLHSLTIFLEKIKNLHGIKEALQRLPMALFSESDITHQRVMEIFGRRGIEKCVKYKDIDELLKNARLYPLMLLDTDSLGEKGKTALIELRRTNMDATLVVFTGEVHHESVSDLLLSGADDYILKPFNEKLLMARINASVRHQMNMRQIRDQKEDLERINLELNRMVIIDGLTQLYNRRFMMESMDKEISKAERYGRGLAVAMLDIDKFKSINDTYGHQEGDAVLVEVSRIIREKLRSCDVAGRYGGEEFIVILPETTVEGALEAAERIRSGVESSKLGVQKISATISIGISCWKPNDKAEDIIRRADVLLYKAKNNGRNRIES